VYAIFYYFILITVKLKAVKILIPILLNGEARIKEVLDYGKKICFG